MNKNNIDQNNSVQTNQGELILDSHKLSYHYDESTILGKW